MAKKGRGPQRTTKASWLDTAVDILVDNGANSIKISTLARELDCARSSFYWYFKNLDDLLDQVLDHWQQVNTNPIVEHAGIDSNTICEAVINIFICWSDEATFNTQLDFAVREWSRHDQHVRRLITMSDTLRIEALRGMYLRHGYEQREALIRARTLYHSQIGYYATEPTEPTEERIQWVQEYVFCFTGKRATSEELELYRQAMTKIFDC